MGFPGGNCAGCCRKTRINENFLVRLDCNTGFRDSRHDAGAKNRGFDRFYERQMNIVILLIFESKTVFLQIYLSVMFCEVCERDIEIMMKILNHIQVLEREDRGEAVEDEAVGRLQSRHPPKHAQSGVVASLTD